MEGKFNAKNINPKNLHDVRKRCLAHQQKQSHKIMGILLGLTAGDRIGGPGQMALQLSKTLFNRSSFHLNSIGQGYLEWWQTAGFDTGPIAEMVFQQARNGDSFMKASAEVHHRTKSMTAGCNPAHRATPLAMSCHIHNNQIMSCAVQDAMLTHQHPLAGKISAIASFLCRHLILADTWDEAIHKTRQEADTEISAYITEGLAGKDLKKDGFAPHVLVAALYFVHSSNSFDEMLERSIDFAGPNNYCPVLAGAIGGARWGKTEISARWLADNKNLATIENVASRLAQQWKDI